MGGGGGSGGVSGVGEARESDHDSALLVTALAVSMGCERAVIINRYSETMFQGKCDQAKRSHCRLRMTPFACGDQKGELQRTGAGASYTKFPRLAFLKCPTKKHLMSGTRESPFHQRRVDAFVSFSTSSACQEKSCVLLAQRVGVVLLLLSGVGLVFTSAGDAKRVDLMLFWRQTLGFLAAPQQHRAAEPVGSFCFIFTLSSILSLHLLKWSNISSEHRKRKLIRISKFCDILCACVCVVGCPAGLSYSISSS